MGFLSKIYSSLAQIPTLDAVLSGIKGGTDRIPSSPATEGGNLGTINTKLGLNKTVVDAGLIASGSIGFLAGDNLTTEKLTSAITTAVTEVHPDGLYLLAFEKPTENTAGNMTVKIYNVIKIDNVNARDCLHSTLTVEMITGVATYRDFLIQGLFLGEASIKIGVYFAADSDAITVYWKLFRL